jgi:hypothetical protein
MKVENGTVSASVGLRTCPCTLSKCTYFETEALFEDLFVLQKKSFLMGVEMRRKARMAKGFQMADGARNV